MFNQNSALAATWAKLVQSGAYTIDQVPALFNLREAVTAALAE